VGDQTAPISSIRPVPTDDEAAAIIAALEVSWPRAGAQPVDDAPPRWRFSGRWWSKPLPMRRDRP
jgi:hypothetical protein